MSLARKPLVLIILDGWGIAPPSPGNAIVLAKTPFFDAVTSLYPTAALQAAGESVGLPYGEQGNSEVGHLNIGAGRILYQDLPRINRAIADGSFQQNPAFLEAANAVRDRGSALHLVGLIGNGGVHASGGHLEALLEFAALEKIPRVFVHAILDGRDTPHNSGRQFLAELMVSLGESRAAKLATVVGRSLAMDRDNRWERVAKAYRAMVFGEGAKTTDPLAAVDASYATGVYDQELEPVVVTDDGTPVGRVAEGDAVIFFNFRSDRARELTKAFVLPGLERFDRGPYLKDLTFVTMTEYESSLPVTVAFPPERVTTPLAKVYSDIGVKQLHVAETEKYAHVTFFLNGGTEAPFPGEERALVPSPADVATYDQRPAMSARAVSERVVAGVNTGQYGLVVVNFANADMVGHTGKVPATVRAVETVDACLGEIIEAVTAVGGLVAITADHGNAEDKVNLRTGFVNTEHTKNPVPFVLVGSEFKIKGAPVQRRDLSRLTPVGVLADVAPTLLAVVGLPKAPEMTGRNLLPILLRHG
jgi:2,3-bisphosphoglycerate-independent phosphoglycerate mutase